MKCNFNFQFEPLDEILWCYNSNETLTAVLFNDATCSTTVSDCYLKVALYLSHPRKSKGANGT